MKARFANKQEIANWNNHVLANPDGGNVFASYEFASVKRLGGYKPVFIFVDNIAITVLQKKALYLSRLWYIPKGPEIIDKKTLWKVLEALKPLAIRRSVFAIRIEPELDRSNESALRRHGLRKARPIIPGDSCVVLDISPSLQQIMEDLPQKGRHAIRRAERDGVSVKAVKANQANCKAMYKLLLETAKGQFGPRNYNYYSTFWQDFEAAGIGQIFFAYVGKRPVAAAFVTVFGNKAVYKDGASVRKRPVYGASHLLMWKAIEWSKSKGARTYDFGMTPPKESINDSEHKLYGLGRFKTSFLKQVTDYVGCYDYIVFKPIYLLWVKFGEKVAHRLYWAKNKTNYY